MPPPLAHAISPPRLLAPRTRAHAALRARALFRGARVLVQDLGVQQRHRGHFVERCARAHGRRDAAPLGRAEPGLHGSQGPSRDARASGGSVWPGAALLPGGRPAGGHLAGVRGAAGAGRRRRLHGAGLPVVPHVRRAGRRRGDLLAMSRGRERRALRRRRPCEGVRRDAEPQGCKCELPAQSDRCTAVFGRVGAHRRHLRGTRRVPLRRRDLPGPRPEDARERGDGLRQGYQPRRAVEEHGHARRADRVARDAGRPLSATRRRAPGLHDDLLVGALPNLGDGRVTK